MTSVSGAAECESISVDRTREAAKTRQANPAPGQTYKAVRHLNMDHETLIAGNRSVDDQVEWLDNLTALYTPSPGFRGDNQVRLTGAERLHRSTLCTGPGGTRQLWCGMGDEMLDPAEGNTTAQSWQCPVVELTQSPVDLLTDSQGAELIVNQRNPSSWASALVCKLEILDFANPFASSPARKNPIDLYCCNARQDDTHRPESQRRAGERRATRADVNDDWFVRHWADSYHVLLGHSLGHLRITRQHLNAGEYAVKNVLDAFRRTVHDLDGEHGPAEAGLPLRPKVRQLHRSALADAGPINWGIRRCEPKFNLTIIELSLQNRSEVDELVLVRVAHEVAHSRARRKHSHVDLSPVQGLRLENNDHANTDDQHSESRVPSTTQHSQEFPDGHLTRPPSAAVTALN